MRCFSGITASAVAPVSLAKALPAVSTLALRTNPAKSGKGSWDASIKVRKNEGKGGFRYKVDLGMLEGLTVEKREGEVEGTILCLSLRLRDGAILPMVSHKVSPIPWLLLWSFSWFSSLFFPWSFPWFSIP